MFKGSWLGLWRAQEKSEAQNNRFKYLYPRILFSFTILECIITQGVDIVLFLDNVEYMCENLIVLFVYGVFISSFSSVLTHENGFRDLLMRMKNMNHPYNLRNKHEKRTSKKYLLMCNILTVCGALAVNLLYVSFASSYHIARRNGLVPQDVIYFRSWYIYNTSESPAFELTMVYRTSLMWLVINGVLTADMVLFVLLFLTMKQFEILRRRIENLRTEAERNVEKFSYSKVRHVGLRNIRTDLKLYHELGLKKSKNQSRINNADENLRKVHKGRKINKSKESVFMEMDKILSECLAHHIGLNRFIADFTGVYSLRLSFQVFANLVGVCVFSLYITVTPGIGVKKVAILVVGFAGVVWFLVFGVMASKIIDESSRLGDALYACDWYDAPETLKRSIRIMMTASNRPVAFVVMGFVPLSVETFATVTNAAYSYFRILANLNLSFEPNRST